MCSIDNGDLYLHGGMDSEIGRGKTKSEIVLGKFASLGVETCLITGKPS